MSDESSRGEYSSDDISDESSRGEYSSDDISDESSGDEYNSDETSRNEYHGYGFDDISDESPRDGYSFDDISDESSRDGYSFDDISDEMCVYEFKTLVADIQYKANKSANSRNSMNATTTSIFSCSNHPEEQRAIPSYSWPMSKLGSQSKQFSTTVERNYSPFSFMFP
ncbi:hypothetical protein CEXT_633361 [Caerostris extrusa]|uniref:Uncharacterized protein n=1 Tax=Caerostris extrusa TaxID=172846 RepID=A0AAV4PU28_CAEEX|nr:hypothetical protein CEXT_633361 [Caerostris extrusa]